MALPFTLKSFLRQKKKNYGNSNISPCKNIIFKRSSKRNQNPSRYHNFITNLKFQHIKISSFKNPHIKIDLLLSRDQKSVKLLSILYNESKHNIIALAGKANKMRWSDDSDHHLGHEPRPVLFGDHQICKPKRTEQPSWVSPLSNLKNYLQESSFCNRPPW